MGKIKELFIKSIEEKYGSYEAYMEEMKEQEVKQWVYMQDTLCPNCNNNGLYKNQDMHINCDTCGQNFVEVNGALRFE